MSSHVTHTLSSTFSPFLLHPARSTEKMWTWTASRPSLLRCVLTYRRWGTVAVAVLFVCRKTASVSSLSASVSEVVSVSVSWISLGQKAERGCVSWVVRKLRGTDTDRVGARRVLNLIAPSALHLSIAGICAGVGGECAPSGSASLPTHARATLFGGRWEVGESGEAEKRAKWTAKTGLESCGRRALAGGLIGGGRSRYPRAPANLRPLFNSILLFNSNCEESRKARQIACIKALGARHKLTSRTRERVKKKNNKNEKKKEKKKRTFSENKRRSTFSMGWGAVFSVWIRPAKMQLNQSSTDRTSTPEPRRSCHCHCYTILPPLLASAVF